MAVNYNIKEVAEQMCDVYCRFPFIISEQELNGVCENCPLERFLKENHENEKSQN